MSKAYGTRQWLSQILAELYAQFSDASEPSIAELGECDGGIPSKMRDFAYAINAAEEASAADSPSLDPSPASPTKVVSLRSPKSAISSPSTPAMDITDARAGLRKLHDESFTRIKSFHHSDVPRCWRRLFTDTALLLALLDICVGPPASETATSDRFYKEIVGGLDEAIVIAGAPGIGRMDMAHDTIAMVQARYLGPNEDTPPSMLPISFDGTSMPIELRASKRIKRSVRGTTAGTSPRSSPSPAFPAARAVTRLLTPPTLSEFMSEYCTAPFILPAYVLDWPAIASWRSPRYLRHVAGKGRKVPVEKGGVGVDYTDDAWGMEMMDWEEFLDTLTTAPPTPASRPNTPAVDGPPVPKKKGRPPKIKPPVTPVPVPPPVIPASLHYLAQHDLLTQFPELRSDIILPDYVYTPLPSPRSYPSYRPPNNDELLLVNAWLGPGGTISPAHYDPFHNCYAQVVGKKTVWLAPPKFKKEMYPYPEKTKGRASSSSASSSSSLSSAPPPAYSLSNTSRVDVFANPASSTGNSPNEFPLFHERVQSQSLCAVLEPGDLLFFPPGWWHAMRAEETSFSVSMWF